MTESFAELFEQSQSLNKLRNGAIVSGIVIEIRSDVVVVNAGLKSEGIIPIEQFKNERGELEIQVGDTVKVALDAIENGFGETMLSREKAKRSLVWDELEEAQTANAAITGRISGKVKGGFTVDIKDVRAFLPGSLVDVRPVRDPSYLEGKELEFKIIKLDRKRNNVVVSRRAIATHGSSPSCFRPSETRFRSRSNLSTRTSSSSPTLTTSDGWRTRFHAMSVMCSRPSIPPRSTNAP